MSRTTALMLALAVLAAGVLAAGSSGARQTQRTIGLVVSAQGSASPPYVSRGAQAAAAALGDQLATKQASDAATLTTAIKSLIAQHVTAIAAENDTDNETDAAAVNQALAQARSAGIPTLSLAFHPGTPGSVWISQSSPAQYAHAFADALASQMRQRGQYIIVPCTPHEPIVDTWLASIKTYVQHRYPRMHRVGVVYSGDGNDAAGTLVLRPLLRAHPHLRGLIFLCQGASYTGPPQLIQAHKVGKVFSAGNGIGYACPPVDEPWLTSVRLGAEEIVCPGDPAKLGYLTVWAADHLAGGQTFASGSYDVGGPVGTVRYFSQNEELRLGQPLTITKANLVKYTG